MDTDDLISMALRAGVLLSVAFISVGALLLLVDGGGGGFSLDQIASTNSLVNSATFSTSQIFYGLFRLDGLSFILFGVMVLVATPITRVIISVFSFTREKNWLYVLITLIVLMDLMIAIFVIPPLIVH